MAQVDEAKGGASRALVAVRADPLRSPRAGRAEPSLVAQLLAQRLDLPEGRRRRRAPPEAVTGAYEAARASLANVVPARLRRSA